MSSLDNSNLSLNIEFKKRVRIIMTNVATAISGEATGTHKPIYITKRSNLCSTIFEKSTLAEEMFSRSVASLGTLEVTIESDGSLTYTGTGTLDGDISNGCASVFNDIAGMTYDDEQPVGTP